MPQILTAPQLPHLVVHHPRCQVEVELHRLLLDVQVDLLLCLPGANLAQSEARNWSADTLAMTTKVGTDWDESEIGCS